MAKLARKTIELIPSDPVAELAVVASCMLDPSKIPAVAKILIPDDFVDPAQKAAFESLLRLHEAGEPAGDPACFMAEFRKRREIPDPFKFARTMLETKNEWITGALAEFYAAKVAEQAKRRFLLDLAVKIREWERDRNLSAHWIANEIVRSIQKRAKTRLPKTGGGIK